MMLLLFLFGLALGAATPSEDHEVRLQRGNCPVFWFSFKGRCYKYVAAEMSWANAELHCVSEGANLVSIHSQDEHNFVKSLIKNSDHFEGDTWIGLSDFHQEGSWMWSDGSAVGFVYWSPEEPDNGYGSEHCVHTNYWKDGKWNDVRCSVPYPSVCATRVACP